MNIFRISLQRKAKTWSQLLKAEVQIHSKKTCLTQTDLASTHCIMLEWIYYSRVVAYLPFILSSLKESQIKSSFKFSNCLSYSKERYSSLWHSKVPATVITGVCAEVKNKGREGKKRSLIRNTAVFSGSWSLIRVICNRSDEGRDILEKHFLILFCCVSGSFYFDLRLFGL